MNTLTDADIARNRALFELNQPTKAVDIRDTVLYYVLCLEYGRVEPTKIDWLNCSVAHNTWYHVCDMIERKKMSTYYKRDRQGSGIDVGGFLGIFASQYKDFRSTQRSEAEREKWFKENIISPMHTFDSTFSTSPNESNTIILIRLPREYRRCWYNELYGSTWLYKFFSRYPPPAPKESKIKAASTSIEDEEEAKIMQIMQDSSMIRPRFDMKKCISECYILLGSWGRLVPKEEMEQKNRIRMRLRTVRRGEEVKTLYANEILNKLRHGAYQSQFGILEDYVHLISDEILEQLTVYDVNGLEKVYFPDLLLHQINVTQTNKRRRHY